MPVLCEYLRTCPFYNDKMDIDSGIGRMYKIRYCEGNKTRCARYSVVTKLGRNYVPVDLYPNMHKWAEKILLGNR